MSLIGYALVSTAEQELSLQLDALQLAGAARIFEDHGVSGAKTERPGLNAALSFLREGDTFMVWKLDRLGRSMTHLLQIVADLEARGVGFRSLTENIDTTTPTGRLVFHIFGAGRVSEVVEIVWRRNLRVNQHPPNRRRQPPGRSRHEAEYR